jgi:hypothetical protein
MATAVSPVAVAPHPPEKKHRHRGWLWLIGFLLVATILTVSYVALVLAVPYSTGQRTGYVQKLSHKGVLCKTYEGELAMTPIPGVAPQIFRFSVRDPKVAQAIDAASGSEVVLDYEQHIGVPTDCFGETEYFVTSVRKAGQ